MTAAIGEHQTGRWRVFAENWDPSYGSPASFDWDDSDTVEQAETGAGWAVAGIYDPMLPLAFIDGCRRAELSMWVEHSTEGTRIPGLVGAYAVGAVTITPGQLARYAGIRIGRNAFWGGGYRSDVISPLGYRWASESTTALDHLELLARLQNRMRLAEGNLALEAAAQGWCTVLDGPLNRVRAMHELVTGYVKTHRRQILPTPDHVRVPTLKVGERTRLFTAGTDRYTCYVRIGSSGPGGSPWGGIARLDLPAVAGLDASAERATQLAGLLPRYAGVPHRDPRAPVNLTPIRNLETHLSRSLGRVELATRCARDAVIAGANS